MPEKTEAQKRAQKNYMGKFAIARVRMEKSRYEDIQAHAAAQGESVNGFINRAIDHEIERDATGGPSEAAGEELPVFVTRAVETQAQRDALSRKMKGGKANE